MDINHLADLARLALKRGYATTAFVGLDILSLVPSVAKAERVQWRSFGGYDDAERQIVCFYDDEPTFPIECIKLQAKDELSHRQILGSVLSLGLKRDVIGDIVVHGTYAYLFCLSNMSLHICSNLLHIGRQEVTCTVLDVLPELCATRGEAQRITVASLRLDAVIGSSLHLSRGQATSLVEQGQVFLNNVQTEKPDRKLQLNDKISVRGWGKIYIKDIGLPTRKGRIPIQLETFTKHSKSI